MSLTTFSGPVASQNGFIDSSFTTAERDAIVDPQAGLLIYNTTVNEYQVYNGTGWQEAFGGPAPSTVTYTYTVDWANTYNVEYGIFGATAFTINQPLSWTNTAASASIIAQPIGTQFTVISNSGANTSILTTTSTFSGGSGPTASTTRTGDAVSGNITSITFTPA